LPRSFIYFPPGNAALQGAAAGVEGLLGYAKAGVAFLFGPLADTRDLGGRSFAIAALPTIVFFAALISILYYLEHIMQAGDPLDRRRA
jgi:CNT family concentrative nucleoside transporter